MRKQDKYKTSIWFGNKNRILLWHVNKKGITRIPFEV